MRPTSVFYIRHLLQLIGLVLILLAPAACSDDDDDDGTGSGPPILDDDDDLVDDPECGNGAVEVGEVCDDGLSCGTLLGCACDCAGWAPAVALCANGILEEPEACDVSEGEVLGCPPNHRCSEGCGLCEPRVCGDGAVDPLEDCDEGEFNGQTPCGCSADCRWVQAGISCLEEGATPDPCRTFLCNGEGRCAENPAEDQTVCKVSANDCENDHVCLNGRCVDQGALDDGFTCGNAAFNDCTQPDFCMEGVCLPQHSPDGTTCGDCASGFCEGCEAGGCLDLRFDCGNSIAEGTETCDSSQRPCDDGCYQGTEICSEDCTDFGACDIGQQACGNSVQEGCEFCDDGAANGQNGKCNATCSGMTGCGLCGDGILDGGACGEVCDDGENSDCYGNCNATCSGPSNLCGDGVVACAEECDDRNILNGDGCASDCAYEPGAMLWRFYAGDAIFSSPTWSANRIVIIGSFDGNLYALGDADGSPRWTFGAGDAINASPPLNRAGLTYTLGWDTHLIHAIDASSGASRWSFQLNDRAYASPTLGPDGALYVGDGKGNLYSLDQGNGAARWQFSAGPTGIGSNVAIDESGSIYFGTWESGLLFSLDAATGTERWRFDAGGGVLSGPTLDRDGNLYAGNWDTGIVFSLKTSDGSIRWSFATGGAVYSSPAIDERGRLFVGSADGMIYAIDKDSGTALWTYSTGAGVSSSPTLSADGKLYVGSGDGYVYALDRDQGTLLWRHMTGAAVDSSPALSEFDGTLYVGLDDGSVLALVTKGLGVCIDCPWPRLGHDSRQTGYLGAPLP